MSYSAPTSIRRNTLINLTGAIVPILVSLTTVPLYLHLIGNARYGVLAIVWALLGYFSIFDLGLGRATSNQVARLRTAAPMQTATLFWTALLINTLLGLVGGGVLLGAGRLLLGGVFKISPDLRLEALSSVPWLAAAVPLITISAVLIGSLEGREHFFTTNILGVLGNVLIQVVPLAIVYWHGPNLAWLIGSIVCVRLVSAVLLFLACQKYVPSIGRPRIDLAWAGILFRYGTWVTVTGVIEPFLTTVDRFVIGAQVGVQVLAYYVVPFNLVTQIAILPASLSRTLFPRFSMLQRDEARVVGSDALLVLGAIMTPMIVGALVVLDPFLTIWIGSDLAEIAVPVGEILLVGIWFNSMALVPYVLLQGQGRPDLIARFHILELPPYLLLLWLGLMVAGVKGAALAWTIRVTVDALLLFRAVSTPWRQMTTLMVEAGLVVLVAISALTLFAQPALRIALGGSFIVMSLVWAWHSAPQLRSMSQDLLAVARRIAVRT